MEGPAQLLGALQDGGAVVTDHAFLLLLLGRPALPLLPAELDLLQLLLLPLLLLGAQRTEDQSWLALDGRSGGGGS